MPSRNYLFFCSHFILLCWAGASTDVQDDSPDCDANSYKCGKPPGDHCLKKSCYSFNTIQKTWNDSKHACKEQPYSNLVSIETKEELVFLQKRIKKLNLPGHREWYIGLTVDEPVWEWVSGKPLTIDHWQKGTREPTGDGEVVIIAKEFPPGEKGSFNDLHANYARGSICEGPKGKYCNGNSSCYTFHENEANWKDSRKRCRQANGSDLVSIETVSEWAFINGIIQKKLLTSQGFRNEWHIGLRRKSWTSWRWINNATYTLGKNMWRHYRPKGTTHYAFMETASSSTNPVNIFSDAATLTEMKPYICERKLVYIPPTK